MAGRRGWAPVIVLAGVGGLLTALATLLADLPWLALPLAVVGTVLAAVGGTLSISAARPGTPRAGAKIVFGAIPNPAAWFQARPAEQEALAKALGGKGRAALVALPGARGAGKSQLAAAYARRCVEKGYHLVAWINAENGRSTNSRNWAKRWG